MHSQTILQTNNQYQNSKCMPFHFHTLLLVTLSLLKYICIIVRLQQIPVHYKQRMSKYIIGCLISASIAIAYALAAGHNSRTYAGIPSFYIIVAIIHLIQIIAFIPAKIFNTEMFYDLTGSITYQFVITFCLLSSDYLTNKQIIAASLVVIWALRLGSFLFYRILKSGHDSRFFTIKKSTIRFFMSWFIQGLWVTLTAGPVYSFLTEKQPQKGDNSMIGVLQILGLAIWIIGLVTETTADFQKLLFNADRSNNGKFINTGLWRYSRHPNYCGQITLWTGVAIFVLRSLEGWQYITLISPIFVYFLLTKVSGVPLLEAKADKKWGGNPQYEKYKKQTPVLFPFLTNNEKTSKQN